jgi:ankyrin repeat protein
VGRGGHKEIAELLLSNGADVNVKKDDGRTPLDFSIKFKNTEITDLLRKHRGNLKLKGNDYPK